MQKYWMVHKVGGTNPQKTHQFESDARAEAQRLAKANPGSCFVILEAKQFCICEIMAFDWRNTA